MLIREGVITATQLQQALEEQQLLGGRLGRHLVDLGYVRDGVLLDALSRQLHIAKVDLEQPGTITPDVARYCRADLAEQWGFCPLSFDARRNLLVIAVSDPDPQLLGDIESLTGMRVDPRVALPDSIDRAIRNMYHGEPAGGSQRLPGLQVARSEKPARENEKVPFPAPATRPATVARPLEQIPPPDPPRMQPTPLPARAVQTLPPAQLQAMLAAQTQAPAPAPTQSTAPTQVLAPASMQTPAPMQMAPPLQAMQMAPPLQAMQMAPPLQAMQMAPPLQATQMAPPMQPIPAAVLAPPLQTPAPMHAMAPPTQTPGPMQVPGPMPAMAPPIPSPAPMTLAPPMQTPAPMPAAALVHAMAPPVQTAEAPGQVAPATVQMQSPASPPAFVPTPSPVRAHPAPGATPVPGGAAAGAFAGGIPPPGLEDLANQMARLDRTLAVQARALRTLVEMLVEKGVITAAEIARKQQQNGR